MTIILVSFQRKPFNSTVIQVYAPTTDAEEAEVDQFYEDLEDLLWPWSTNEAGERLTEFCQENALVIANTLFQQHKRRLYTWTSPNGQYQNQIDYILCS